MRRYAVVLIVLALLVSGCAAKEMAAKASAKKEISEADRLAGEKRYDEAVDHYLGAAAKAADPALADTAVGKAGDALTASLERKPLSAQVTALRAFAKRLPTGMLPLSAHNWLCGRLRAEAEAVKAVGTSAEAESHKLVAAYTPPPAPKRATAKKPPAKPAAKKPAAKPAPTPVVAPSTVATSATADELRAIAAELPALGQPPAMRQLYAALAELRAAADSAEQARAGIKPGTSLTLTQRRVLTKADVTLERALAKVKGLLASAV